MIVGWRAAAPALRSLILGYVERAGGVTPDAAIALPCAIPAIRLALGGDEPAAAFCHGTRTARIVAGGAAGAAFVIALGFGGAAWLAPVAPTAALDRSVDLADGFWTALRARLSHARGFAARAALADRLLAARLGAVDRALPGWLRAADAIVQDRWSGPVRDLAERCGMEERTLRNRFRRELGWGPKRLLRVARFNRAVRALHPRPWPGPAAGDVRLEFSDEAHFHREFRAHAGLSPATFAAAKRRSGDMLLHSVALDGGG